MATMISIAVGVEQFAQCVVVGLLLCHAQVQRDRREPDLGAVMQVALNGQYAHGAEQREAGQQRRAPPDRGAPGTAGALAARSGLTRR